MPSLHTALAPNQLHVDKCSSPCRLHGQIPQIIKHLHAAGIDPSKAVTALVLCIGSPLLLLFLRPRTYARHRTRVIMLMYELPWQLLLTCQAVSRPIASGAVEGGTADVYLC